MANTSKTSVISFMVEKVDSQEKIVNQLSLTFGIPNIYKVITR